MHISLKVDDGLNDKLLTICENREQTKSQLIRWLIKKEIKEDQDGEKIP